MQRQTSSPDFLSSLPNEILIHLLSFLEKDPLLAMLLVTKQFYDLGNDNRLWFRFFGHQTLFDRSICYKDLPKITLLSQLTQVGKAFSNLLMDGIQLRGKKSALVTFYRFLLANGLYQIDKKQSDALIGILIALTHSIANDYSSVTPRSSTLFTICDAGLDAIFSAPLSLEKKITYLTALEIKIQTLPETVRLQDFNQKDMLKHVQTQKAQLLQQQPKQESEPAPDVLECRPF